ncbi:hypothetical protein Fmac_027783 [Flemingia macrophylla]|uniref:Uncharacterized protein n=1 Tax=Flemingia macrophylla TaxID=520843 RepID=A0ABD1LIQ8_9FABA
MAHERKEFDCDSIYCSTVKSRQDKEERIRFMQINSTMRFWCCNYSGFGNGLLEYVHKVEKQNKERNKLGGSSCKPIKIRGLVLGCQELALKRQLSEQYDIGPTVSYKGANAKNCKQNMLILYISDLLHKTVEGNVTIKK